jgi:PA14 domain
MLGQPRNLTRGVGRLLVTTLFVTSGWLLVCGTPLGAQPTGQVMPDGWRQMNATQFANAVDQLFMAYPPPAAHEAEVVAHAWNQFLNNEAFVSTGDLNALVRIVDWLGWRRTQMVSGDTDEARAESLAQIEANAATLGQRVAARVVAERSALVNSTFAVVNQAAQAMGATNAPPLDRARLYADWMAANDWQALSLADEMSLLEGLAVDQIAGKQLAARWTGSITAPVTGAYTLEQLPERMRPSAVKVWIGNELVLDSSPRPTSEGEAAGSPYRSQPVSLTAGQAVPIRVELAHDMADAEHKFDGVPHIVLTWEATGVSRQIIPSAAFSPPVGFGDAGARGLKGEYFQGLSVAGGQPRVTRLDAALDLVWSAPLVAPALAEEYQAVRDHCVERVMSDAELAGLEQNAAAARAVLEGAIPRVVHHMTLAERRVFVGLLASRPALLRGWHSLWLGHVMLATYMLPGREHVELLGAWAATNDPPRHEAGTLVYWQYEAANMQGYFHIGWAFNGPYAAYLDALLDQHLTSANGECNLHIARAAAFAMHRAETTYKLRERLRQALQNERLTGDQRATWLVARAYVDSCISSSYIPRIERAFPYLEEALLVAESPAHRFWMLEETATRYASIGMPDKVDELVERYGASFSAPTEQAAMAAWKGQARTMAEGYAAAAAAK